MGAGDVIVLTTAAPGGSATELSNISWEFISTGLVGASPQRWKKFEGRPLAL
jgi:hypothetical protein